MGLIRSLQDINQQELSIVGGKGVNLGVLTHAGFPVPPGFVLLTDAYQHFLSMNNLMEEVERLAQQTVPEDLAACERASQSIRALFTQSPMPEEIAQAISLAYQQLGIVAIRSSATTEDLPTASFAGLHESYLNVKTLEDAIVAVRQCWSSLWTARALSYRARLKSASQTISMAVIIQQMVQADGSGVLFTVNPVSGMHEEMVINATWGVGEALVAGQITPDTIIVEKTSGRIIMQEIGKPLLVTIPTGSGMNDHEVENVRQRQFVLTNEQVTQLARLGEQVEKYFGAPQDIEWVITGEQLFIVQARPITTLATLLPRSQETSLPPGDDTWDRELDTPSQPYDVWTRTNVGENLPYPITPLTETNFPILFSLNNNPSEPQSTRRLYGRLYFNEGALFRSFTEDLGLPAAWLHKMWGSRSRGTYVYKNTFRPLLLLLKLFSLVVKRFKVQKKVRTPRDTPEQFFAQIDQWVSIFMRFDLTRLDEDLLWKEGLPIWSKRGDYAWATNLRFSINAAVSYGLLERIVRWWTKFDVAQDLVTGLPGVYSAEVGPALWRIARLAQKSGLQDILLTHDSVTALDLLRSEKTPLVEPLEEFLARHGHRCPNELEMRNPRWVEAPEQVIELIVSYLRAGEQIDPIATEARQQQRRTAAVAAIEAKLGPIRRAIFHFLLKRAQFSVTVRDNSRYFVAKYIFPVRKIYAELGRRWAERNWLKQADDIFFLTVAEIEDIVENKLKMTSSSELQARVEQRRLAYEFWFTIVAPDAVGADGLPIVEEEKHLTQLKGTPASSGTIRGRARIVQTIQEAMSLESDTILVTTATDPGWTPIFPLVGGIVLEIGGQLSHGAIIAREYGIPAVVNVPGAMHLIQDGQEIEVDGSNGVIKLF